MENQPACRKKGHLAWFLGNLPHFAPENAKYLQFMVQVCIPSAPQHGLSRSGAGCELHKKTTARAVGSRREEYPGKCQQLWLPPSPRK